MQRDIIRSIFLLPLQLRRVVIMRNKNKKTDPERKLLMETKQLEHSVVLTLISDYMGMQCTDPPCGRTKMEISTCMFCKHKEIIAGRKEPMWV